MKPDLDNKENIHRFVSIFYHEILNDKHLAPIFLDVAQVDLSQHLPLICQYWEKLLLGEPAYQRHTMNIHRAVDAKQSFKSQDFEQWLSLFTAAVDQHFEGPCSQRAKSLGKQIANNMASALLS